MQRHRFSGLLGTAYRRLWLHSRGLHTKSDAIL
jgi:hypothetical protein